MEVPAAGHQGDSSVDRICIKEHGQSVQFVEEHSTQMVSSVASFAFTVA
jgi:hypothetical protein